jgi:hypothetical protein
MAKPNYQYEKRQRELEKKRKKEEKALKKSSPGDGTASHEAGSAERPDTATPESEAPSA